MKIVELGYSGAGKTTYMASMYGVLQRSFGGFTLRSLEEQEHERLLQLYWNIKTNSFPLPTSQRDEYDFYLKHNGKEIFRFRWADYRGKALRETLNSYEAGKLHEDLCTADGIMIFCDSHALSNGNARTNEIRRITTLVSKAFQDLDQPISLSIILTKIDLVNEIHPNIINSLKGLIDTIEASNLVSGALVPVACGRKMFNTPLPILFALQARVRSKVDILKEKIQEHESQANRYGDMWRDEQNKASGFFGGLRDILLEVVEEEPHYKKANRYWEKYQNEEEELKAALNEWQPLVEPANALDAYTRNLILIENGKSSSEYIQQLSSTKPKDFKLEIAKFINKSNNLLKSLFKK